MNGTVERRSPVALVTGAGRRLGQAIALALARRGYDLAVHYHSSAAGAELTASSAAALGRRAVLLEADLTDAGKAASLVADARSAMGALDVVVNSAAVMLRTPFGAVSPAEWDFVMALNLRAPFLIAQEAARHLSDGGSIVNIADLAAFETWPDYIPHGASKSALVYLTRALARVLAPRVRVNGVAPGSILPPPEFSERARERLAQTTPLGRWGDPEDVAQAVLYLVEASYVTGEVIFVDGGRHIR
jgi:NAD(P)-dependent dehydrogenase (short-subunit alcohol dehydrogenase family)